MLVFETHQSCRPDAITYLEEDEAILVGHTGNLPWSHLSHLVALINNKIGNDEGLIFFIDGKLLTDAILQLLRYTTGHGEHIAILLHLVGSLVIFGYRGPVPFFLRTGPESTTKGLWPSRLRDDFLIVILEGEDLSTLGAIDGHSEMTILQTLQTFMIILCISGLC